MSADEQQKSAEEVSPNAETDGNERPSQEEEEDGTDEMQKV